MGKDVKLTLGEEIANSTTHGAMAAFTLITIPFTAIFAYVNGGILDAVGLSIFNISIFLMFLASTLYHAMSNETRHKKIFRILDHVFIYVAIAGSYTPIALSVIGGWKGIVIVVLQWSMVLFGILYRSINKLYIPKINVTIYMIMGWTIVVFAPSFISHARTELLILLLLGGIFYSAGTAFYAKKGVKYFHMIWHLFVNLGAAAHFIALVFFLK